MFELHPLTSWDLPALAPYRTMRRPMEHRKEGVFLAEGEKVVRRMLESSTEVLSLILPEKWIEIYRPLIEARPEKVLVFQCEKERLEELSRITFYQGVLGIGRIPQLPTLAELFVKQPGLNLWIAADGITSAGNMGIICRNAAALGAQALIVGESSCTPYIRWAVHSSMGELFKLQIIQPPSLKESLSSLKKQGVRCIAAHPHTDKKYLPQCDLTGPICLVFGSEGEGVSSEILEECDESVAIPMSAGVDSLNVANCVALFLYEALRQRGFSTQVMI